MFGCRGSSPRRSAGIWAVPEVPVLAIAEAEALILRTLVRCRTSEANARSVARALSAAEADGLKGHGLSRLPTYAAQARRGKVDGFAEPVLSRPRPAVIAVDAAHGFAFAALDAALAALPDVVRSQRLAAQGIVALIFANTPAAIAPWGGRKGVFGTNPIAFACPLPEGPPIVVDLSLSKVARGNILAAKQRGERIPDDWALDETGKPTSDPEAALKGTMLPLGDAKGTALALMVELLAAGLTGASYAADASSFLDDKGGPPGTGQLIVALDPAAFGGADTVARFGALAVMIEAQAGARLPGRRRLALREKAQREGLPIADALLLEIENL